MSILPIPNCQNRPIDEEEIEDDASVGVVGTGERENASAMDSFSFDVVGRLISKLSAATETFSMVYRNRDKAAVLEVTVEILTAAAGCTARSLGKKDLNRSHGQKVAGCWRRRCECCLPPNRGGHGESRLRRRGQY